MDNVLSDYQKWKQQGESLRTQAKQAMETTFRDLLLEAARIAQEYHGDFGATLKPPPSITAFRYKASGAKAKPRPGSKTATRPAPLVKSAPDPKVASLQKKLALTKTKLEAARASAKPTKNLEDRIYEIEDELRLSGAIA